MSAEPEEREDGPRPKREAGEWVPPLRGKIPPGTPPFDIHKFREELYEGGPRPKELRLDRLGLLRDKIPPSTPPPDLEKIRDELHDYWALRE